MSTYIDSELQDYCKLVLCIEERDDPEDYNNIDGRIFIFWEEISGKYIIFGRRELRENFNGIPYAFTFDKSKDVCKFVDLIIKDRITSVTYYNFNNLYNLETGDLKLLNYEFFENNMDKNYEVIGYDEVSLEYNSLRSRIKLLRSSIPVFNK
jgi:hypothetical protein